MKSSAENPIVSAARRTMDDAAMAVRNTADDVRDTVAWVRQRNNREGGLLIEPARFQKILITLLKLLIVVELVSALLEGLQTQRWARFGIDLVIAGALYILWDRISGLVRERKQWARERIERSAQDISLWDALVFSLLWSDEITRDVPQDRRRLVVSSYTLIALGVVAAFVSIGTGLMPVVIAGALVLGGVNLLAWVASLERGEKEQFRAELTVAREMQLALMPKSDPLVEGLDIAGLCVPARDVGGDLYEYTSLGETDGTFAVGVTDVSGKGMEAAMEAVFTSGAFAAEAKCSGSTAEVLTRLNRVITRRSRKGQFVAFLLLAVDPLSRTIRFCNAGQSKPLLRSGDSVRWLDGAGVHFPLGMQENTSYAERKVKLSAGDVLFLSTDGITEAMNVRKDLFGTERFEALVAQMDTRTLRAADMIARVTRAVEAHTGAAAQHDDMTLVVIRIL